MHRRRRSFSRIEDANLRDSKNDRLARRVDPLPARTRGARAEAVSCEPVAKGVPEQAVDCVNNFVFAGSIE